MFKYWSLKKYGNKLLPTLEKHYGSQKYFTASQIRTVVYTKDFAPEFLPLGYILFIDPSSLSQVIEREFPELDINEFKKEILTYQGSS